MKIGLLKRIVVLNEQQKHFFENDSTEPDELEENIRSKGSLVDQVLEMDEGFEGLYERVSEELSRNREAYKEEIRSMQEMVRSITELSAKIQSQEQRNRSLASSFYGAKKTQTKKIRQGAVAIGRYQQGMMRTGPINPQIMDTKE